jgi:hypothetical protein
MNADIIGAILGRGNYVQHGLCNDHCGTWNTTLPTGALSTSSGEKEYSMLETAKIQAACGLINAQWDTDLPKLYLDARGREEDYGMGEGTLGRYLQAR